MAENHAQAAVLVNGALPAQAAALAASDVVMLDNCTFSRRARPADPARRQVRFPIASMRLLTFLRSFTWNLVSAVDGGKR